MERTQKIEISARTIIFTVLFLGLLRMLWISRELLYALFLAFIFMSALKPVVRWLDRKKIPHNLSVIAVFSSVISAFLFFFAFVLPPLITESTAFIRTFPILVENAFTPFSFYLQLDSVDNYLPEPKDVVALVKGVFSNVIFIISIIFFTFYFLLDERLITSFFDKFVEKKQAAQIVAVFEKVERRMGAWVRGQLVLMTIIGLFTYVGLSILGVPYAFPLALVAGLLEVVPIIGPIVSAVPALFVALSSSTFMGVSVIVLYFLVQQLENNIIVPMVMKRAVGMNPIMTLIAITIGGKLGGLMGIILSVPAALLIETVVIELARHQSGEDSSTPTV